MLPGSNGMEAPCRDLGGPRGDGDGEEALESWFAGKGSCGTCLSPNHDHSCTFWKILPRAMCGMDGSEVRREMKVLAGM